MRDGAARFLCPSPNVGEEEVLVLLPAHFQSDRPGSVPGMETGVWRGLLIHDGSVYPPGLAVSRRTLAYSCCNASTLASICHLNNPRHLGSSAWRRTLRPPFQESKPLAMVPRCD